VLIRQAARAPNPAMTPNAINIRENPRGTGSPSPWSADMASAAAMTVQKASQARRRAVSVIEPGLVTMSSGLPFPACLRVRIAT